MTGNAGILRADVSIHARAHHRRGSMPWRAAANLTHGIFTMSRVAAPSMGHGFRHSAFLATLLVTACSAEKPLVPLLPVAVTGSELAAMSFTATVHVQQRAVSIAPPSTGGVLAPTASTAGNDAPLLSLLGGDVVRLVPSNVRISAPGAFAPHKIRVTFDVAIEPRLRSLALTAPTWPQPPVPAVIMFPLDHSVTQSPGGVSGTDGNSIVVSLPTGGSITPSIDWNGTGEVGSGAPYDFFAETRCGANSTRGCFRWVAYGTRLDPTGPRQSRTVGYDIDATVQQFRTRMLVAADLVPATAPAQ